MHKTLVILTALIICTGLAVTDVTVPGRVVNSDLLSDRDNSSGTLIFSETFDSQPDWSPTGVECVNIDSAYYNNRCPDEDAPPNWDWYINAQDEWQPVVGQRISSDVYRGVSGKSWIKSSESNHESGTSNYYSDAQLLKYFPSDESDEIYVELYIKLQNGWQWETGSPQFKLFRVGRFTGTEGVDDPISYGSSADNGPMYFFDLRNSTNWGWRHVHAPRCSPISTNYFCDEDGNYKEGTESEEFTSQASFADMGDGNWHKLAWHVKLNTQLGVEDGIIKFWVDDVLEYSVSNIDFVGANGDFNNAKFNVVAIGGNWNNWYDDPANQSEQWYAIDDVKIYNAVP